jgi:WD40 repeat protein
MKKLLLLLLSTFALAGSASSQTPWLPWSLALDSSMVVSQLNLALDSSGFTLAAPGTLPSSSDPVLFGSHNGAAWVPMDITGLDSNATAVKSFHRFFGDADIIVAVDSAGNQSYASHDGSGALVAVDSIWIGSFQVHNFLALDSITLACGMNAATTHPTIITSVDSGATWSPMTSPFPFALDSGFTSLAGWGSTLVVMALDSLTHQSLFLSSSDAGASWNAPSSTFPGSATVNGLAVDSLGNYFAAGHDAGGAGVWRSTDGGSSWLPMDLLGIDLDSAITAIALVGSRLVVAGIDSLGRSQVYQMMLSTSRMEASSDLAVSVGPNPSEGVFNVSLADATGNWDISLIDLQGRTVCHQQLQAQQLQAGVSVGSNSLSPGIYLLQLAQDNKSFSTRVMITR